MDADEDEDDYENLSRGSWYIDYSPPNLIYHDSYGNNDHEYDY
jgi:hypothetical protein